MPKRPPVQYVQFYTDGSAARQPEVRPLKKQQPKHRQAKKTRYVLYVCPVALCGILVAAVLLVMMAVGTAQLLSARREREEMARYVTQLQLDNRVKAQEYEESLDLEDIRRQALALGMIPESEGPRMEIALPQEAPQVTVSFWDRLVNFFVGLF